MKTISLEEIERYVNMYLKGDIRGKSRKRNIVYKRAIFAVLALENCKVKYPSGRIAPVQLEKVGKYINKDHATIMHYRDNLADVVLEYEPDFLKCYENFQTYLKVRKEHELEHIEKLISKNDIEKYKYRLYYQADNEKEYRYMQYRIKHAQTVMKQVLCN